MLSIDKEVCASAKLLDITYPTWFLKVTPDNLRMTSWQYCVLGQLYGTYANGMKALSIHWSGVKEHGAAGFACIREETERAAELEVAWKKEIKQRLEA
jgi:hypothetical protein